MSLKRNILANYFGQVWLALIGLLFVPLYLRSLGIEAYGLIGLFTTLLAVFALLDLGLGSTISREMARLGGSAESMAEARDLLRTFEVPYCLIALLIGTVLVAVSGWIARDWVNARALTSGEVQQALMAMGLSVAARWPVALYTGALLGLERQVMTNAITIIMETVRAIGAVLVLWLVSPTLIAFFLWQAVVSALHTLALRVVVRAHLGRTAAHFRRDLLKTRWRFAAGITATTLLSTILMQLDKIILSRLLSLETFGYYALANVVALTLYRLFGPIFTAVYPRLTRLMHDGASAELAVMYHAGAQVLSVAVLPAAAVLVMFAYDLMLVWTGDVQVATHTHVLVSVLALGTAMNGLMHIPYALQLAAGWTQLALLLNLCGVVLLVPLLFVLTWEYGAVGAASVWLLLNALYVLTDVQLMHRRLLPRAKRRWYAVDVAVPAAVSFGSAAVLKLVQPDLTGSVALSVYIAGSGALALGATALATPVTRELLLHRLWVPAAS